MRNLPTSPLACNIDSSSLLPFRPQPLTCLEQDQAKDPETDASYCH